VILGRDHSTKSIEDRLKGLEPTRNKLLLNEYLKNGIAFHHAELTVQERREVEDAFRNMEICVLFCTSTLARGINVPANVVVSLVGEALLISANKLIPVKCNCSMSLTIGWVG